MFAYFTAKIRNPVKAREHECWGHHLYGGGPYHYRSYLHEGKSGVIATPKISDEPMVMDRLGDVEEIDDGIFYYHIQRHVNFIDLARMEGPEFFKNVHLTYKETTVSMPIVHHTARKWDFKKMDDGGPITEFGKLGDKLMNLGEGDLITYKDIAKFVFEGLRLNYHLTADVMNDFNFVKEDFIHLYKAGLGLDPKFSGTKEEEQK